MDLTEFLLARIAEDEERAGDFHHVYCPYTRSPDRECTCGNPDRVLAGCEAKRRIVGRHDVVDTADGCAFCGESAPCEHLRILAAMYADHPDSQEAWRP